MIRLDINSGNLPSLFNRGDEYADNVYFLRYNHARQSSKPIKGKRYFEITMYSANQVNNWIVGLCPMKFTHNGADYKGFPYPKGSVVFDSVWSSATMTDEVTGVSSRVSKPMTNQTKDGVTAGVAYDSDAGTVTFFLNGEKYFEGMAVYPSVNSGKFVDAFPFVGIYYYSSGTYYYPMVAKFRTKKSEMLYPIPDGYFAIDDESDVLLKDGTLTVTKVGNLFQSTTRQANSLGYANTDMFSEHFVENLIGVTEGFFVTHEYDRNKFDTAGGLVGC